MCAVPLHPLLDRIEEWVLRSPETPALLCEGKTLSYVDLWERALAIAGRLSAEGMGAGDRVAFDAKRDPEDFVVLLGILLADGIYVPISDKAPQARRDVILEDCGARFHYTQGELRRTGSAAPSSGEPAGYILYTSGSTGVPKGVQVSNDNVVAFLDNLQAAYPLIPGERSAQLADLGFDLSVQEIFHAWTAGATLCVIPTRHTLMWPRYIRDLGVANAALVPSQVRLAHNAGLLKPDSLPGLRRVILGAELVTGAVVRHMRSAAPDAELTNLWGPTEATVYLTHYPIVDPIADHEGVPIGRPWPGQTLLLDKVQDGVGEMLIGGSQVCRGYWNLPQANAERFELRDGCRYYRTGDLGRYDEEHGYIFVGRIDRQVKIKGNRIELDECEKAVRLAAGTDQAYVMVDGDSLICAIRADFDASSVEAGVRSILPGYMVPGKFVKVDEIPMNTSGKADLKQLFASITARR